MFSGIIQSIGVIHETVFSYNGGLIVIKIPRMAKQVMIGSSVSISGVCLTVTARKADRFSFDVLKETLTKTTLAEMTKGGRVNVEPSLRVGDELSGHFVYGHVDGVGEVCEAATHAVTIKPPKHLMRYIVPQGSIAIDGVSLTVARLVKGGFAVALTPYTVQHTTLGLQKNGDKVNLEVDMMLKGLSARGGSALRRTKLTLN